VPGGNLLALSTQQQLATQIALLQAQMAQTAARNAALSEQIVSLQISQSAASTAMAQNALAAQRQTLEAERARLFIEQQQYQAQLDAARVAATSAPPSPVAGTVAPLEAATAPTVGEQPTVAEPAVVSASRLNLAHSRRAVTDALSRLFHI
jgi:hypothetical protein